MKSLIPLFLVLLFSCQAESQDAQSDITNNKGCLLEEQTIDSKPALIINLNDDPKVQELVSVFKNHGYKYKGFIWDNGLWEVVNQLEFGLLHEVEVLEEEETRLLVVLKDNKARTRFLDLICPVLNNPSELDSILADAKKE